jgi:hypothetical protein
LIFTGLTTSTYRESIETRPGSIGDREWANLQ